MKNLLLALVVLAFGACGPAYAGPLAIFQDKDNKITIFDEPCRQKEIVSNLPYRIVWEVNNKVYEGCAGAFMGGHVVGAYFPLDKSMAVMPANAFQAVKTL